MKWIEVEIKTTTEAVEAVANILYEAGVSGVVIEDPKDKPIKMEEEDLGSIENISDMDLEGVLVKGYLPADSTLMEKIQEIKQSVDKLTEFNLDKGLGEVKLTEISEEDWASSWKSYYKPFKVGQNIVIKPTWEEYDSEPNDVVIEIDPGMAFGTGTHETTIMCLKMLEQHVANGEVVLDIGCGSGILSIAAAKLGAGDVYGIDIDPNAIKVAKKNVVTNGVNDRVKIIEGDLVKGLDLKADIVVSNIIADTIINLISQVSKNMREHSKLILSGIIKDRKFEVMEALERNGFDILKTEEMGEWITILSVQAMPGQVKTE
ncbi:MAG: ribosomal protein methyltransferase [Thermosediminibacterales bacterium]|nr:ribosomal protein methyltransferase [Thermosediminibacterales bacterium]